VLELHSALLNCKNNAIGGAIGQVLYYQLDI